MPDRRRPDPDYSLPAFPSAALPGAGAIGVHRITSGGDLLALDHVALTVADPDATAAFCCDHLGMHELIRRTGLVVVGAGGGAAPLALLPAAGPRDPGALRRLVLRVADVERAVAALPEGTDVEGDRFELATFEGPERLALGFTMVAGGAIDYDLDHVKLRVSDVEQTRIALAELGCVPRGESLHVADKNISLVASPSPTERPLLAHLAVRVESVQAVADQALARGLEIDGGADDEDTFAVVLPGPERLRLRFVSTRAADRSR